MRKQLPNELKENFSRDEEQLRREIQERQRKLRHEFTVGHRYSIRESGNAGKGAIDSRSLSGTTWSNEMIFEYTGKHGLHHCFKATPGGWSRTYTDNQLIGKKIMEVR